MSGIQWRVDAPTPALGGLPAASPLHAPAGDGRRARGARLLPRYQPSLRRGGCRPSTTGSSKRRSCGSSSRRSWSSCSSASSRSGGATWGTRDTVAVLEAVVVNTLALAGFVALFHPVTVDSRAAARSPCRCRPASWRSSSCSPWSSCGGTRFAARMIYERPIARLPCAARRAAGADRRRGRRRAPGAARDRCAIHSSASPRSASSTTTRSSAGCGSTA